MKFKIDTKLNDERVEIDTYYEDELTKKRNSLGTYILELRDKAIRNALIALGWTPPRDNHVEDTNRDFYTWWHNEGSGITPLANEDMEAFAERLARIAWDNGAYKERHKHENNQRI